MSSIRLNREQGEPARANIVQLRDLLGQRFPGVRMNLAEKPPARPCFATGVPQIDAPKGIQTAKLYWADYKQKKI